MAAALVMLGRAEKAARIVAPVLASAWPPCLERQRAHIAWRYRSGTEHWLEGLALAGLPEQAAGPDATPG